MRKNLLALFLVFTFILPYSAVAQSATKKNSAAMKAAQTITAKQMSDYLYFIASDAMEGRDTPSRGLDTTAEFIKMNLSRWGFKPAGDNGTFFQKIALNVRRTDASKTSLEIGGQKLAYGVDYFSDANAAAIADSPVVFVGGGWLIKSKNIDDLKDVDVKGKTVVIFSNGLPNGVTNDDFRSGTLGQYGRDWLDPRSYVRQKGAVGIITIATPKTEENWDAERTQRERGGASVEKFQQNNRGRNIPTLTISRKAAENLFAGESKSFADISNAAGTVSAFALNKTAKYTVEVRTDKASTQNVVAIWEGSDPVLKNEMVAIGAHYDHVGMNPTADGEDKIWNGADDDGSGTTGVLAIAEALGKSKKRPKRSILFVWHAGEEKGLWGSRYFVENPTVPLDKVVAQLNIDMIGRSRKTDDKNPANAELSGENEIYVIGSKMMSSQLGNVVDSVNNSYLKLNYNFKYDDPNDPNRFFFRSDHFNYAVKGIPITFWFDGVHQDYHGADDEADRIDYAKMEKVTRTIFLTMWELGDAKTRPVVEKQLPKELMER